MHFMKLLPAFLCSALLAATMSCEQHTANESTASGAVEGNATQSALTSKAVPQLICEEIRSTDDPLPRAVVYLVVGKEKLFVDSVSVCGVIEAVDFDDKKIPKSAKAAVGGWWGGAGDYYYLIEEGDDAVVMHGWDQEESEEKEMYQYKEKKRASLLQ